MKGINISSAIMLLIIVLNTAIFIISKCIKNKQEVQRSAGIKAIVILILNAALIFCLIYFSTVIGITRYNVGSEKIPSEFDGFKILQISDFHTGTFHGGTEKLIYMVKKEKPDIVVLTGDLIDENNVNLVPVTRLVSQLTPTLPVYAVSGNHDVWYYNFEKYQNMLRKFGVTILENKKVILRRGKAEINLYGIGDPYTWNDKSAEEYLNESITGLKPSTGYNILLFHRANMFDAIKGKGFQLVFSGHMHGGQLQIPFRGGLISPQQNRRWFPAYTDGRWTEADTTMLVSRGLGNNVPVPRFLNPPEIVVATLRSK